MKKILFFLIVLHLILWSNLWAVTHFVTPAGNDGDSGTKESPWQTIQQGLDNTFAGDTLFIRGGAYYIDDNLFVRHSGNPNNWVTIMAYPGEEVAINADAVAKRLETVREGWRWHGSLHISGVHYIRIQGLTILYSHGGGIMVRGKKGTYGEKSTTNIEISHCKIHSSYNSGIGIWYSDPVKVTYCEIMDANNQRHRPIGFPIKREAPHEALSVPGTSNFEIAYNYLHMNQKEGIDVKEFSNHGKVHHNYCHDILREGIYIDSWFGELHDIEVYENIVHDCDWGILLSAEGKKSNMKNIYVHDNLVYNNFGKGIAFSVLGHDEPRENIHIYNNTICFNGTPAHWSGETGGIGILSPNLQDIYIYNNILYKNYGYQIATFADISKESGRKSLKDKNIFIENNLMDGVYEDPSTNAGFFKVDLFVYNGKKFIIADPGFVNDTGFDFRLKETSQAIGKSISKGNNEHNDLGANLSNFADIPNYLVPKFINKPSHEKQD